METTCANDLITRIIESMLSKGSDGLLLMEGKPPVMRVDGKPQTLSVPPLTTADLRDFITGPLRLAGDDLCSGAARSARYEGASRPVQIKCVNTGEALSLQVTPATAAGPTGAGPAAAGPAAPAAPAAPATPPTSTGGSPAAPTADAPAAATTTSAPRLERYFKLMIERGASDLHLSSGMPPILRHDGEMVPLDEAPLGHDQLHELLMEIIPERNRAEYAEVRDTDFAYEIPGQARFRCNYFYDRNGCGAVFRQIPVDILTAEQLGLSPQLLKLCNLTKGLVVVTGPTGSGKSTTLAALIDHINKTRRDHIITIEDPIEFVHLNHKCLVNQREVNVHTAGFKPALRAALREDPDIVLVGEMRDLETISIAIETAETGHLVFGTLHTTTAVSTIDRIIDQFPPDRQGQVRVMLSESLRGVIAQTLCKKKGGGRVAAQEVLLFSRAISNLIREGKTFQIPSAMQTGRKEGMMLLNDALMDLVNRDLISADEAYMKAVDKDGIEPLLKGKGLTLGVDA